MAPNPKIFPAPGFLAAILCFFLASTAQAQLNLNWGGVFGDTAHLVYGELMMDQDENLYSTGHFYSHMDAELGSGTTTLNAGAAINNIFVVKNDSAGAFMWGIHLTGDDSNIGPTCLADDGVIISGSADNLVDFDPSPGTYTMTTGSSTFVAKYSELGALAWVRRFTVGIGSISPRDVTTDTFGNCYLIGSFFGTVDFDPGPGTASHTSSSPNGYILKLDASGNFVSAHRFVSPQNTQVTTLSIDNSGNIWVGGSFINSVDLDLGPGSMIITGASTARMFIAKYSPAMSLLFHGEFVPAPGMYFGESIAMDDNSITFGGRATGPFDADPGVGTQILNTDSIAQNMFFLQLDSAGAYRFSGWAGNTNQMLLDDIAKDKHGSLYLTGAFMGDVDFDPGLGVEMLSNPDYSTFLVKVNKMGELVWGTTIGSNTGGIGVEVNDNLDIYHAGQAEGTNDYDPGPGIFSITTPPSGENNYLLKLAQDSCFGLTVVVDTVASLDCASGLGYASASASGGYPPYSWVWNTSPPTIGPSATFLSGGFYEVTLTDSIGCESTRNVLVNGPTSSGIDLAISLITSPAVPGFTSCLFFDAQNLGCTPQTGYAYIVLPPLFHYSYASPSPDAISGDTLFWNFSSLTYDSAHVTSIICGLVDSAAVIGDDICFLVGIEPVAGDADPSNNIRTVCRQLVGSYDPNDKQVFPSGICTPRFTLKSEPVQYTVRFQNTGTAEAINVSILDTLSPLLDINSVNVLASSHTVIVELEQDSILRFRYPGIHLPDSSSDFEGSQGYVVFSVSTLPGIASGSLLTNSVGIYFDANAPVQTNTVSNTMVDVLPAFGSDTTHFICPGGSVVLPDGLPVDSVFVSQDFSSTFPGAYGCDSIVTTHVIVSPSYAIAEADTICAGADYIYPDGSVSTSVTLVESHTSALVSHLGCDSIIETTLYPIAIDTTITTSGGALSAVTIGGASYQWHYCDSIAIPGATGSNFTPAASGNYMVEISHHGCTTRSGCHLVILTAAEDPFASQLTISPNPTSRLVNISSDATMRSVLVASVTGVQMLSVSPSSRTAILDLMSLPNGIYFVQIITDKGEYHCKIHKY